jgi:RTX calcium-binding nonapeptide repeat (4 copies)
MPKKLLLVCISALLLIFTAISVEGWGQPLIAHSSKDIVSLDGFNALLPMHSLKLLHHRSPIAPKGQIALDLDLPTNLISPTPSCSAGKASGGAASNTMGISTRYGINNYDTSNRGSGSSNRNGGCPKIIGTNGPDIIIASAVPGAQIYGLAGNDVIQCGTGNCKVYSGPGDNIMMSSSSTTAQLYGGSGNNVFIGSGGDTFMVGGKGNDQFYGGSGHDVMIGGGGANYFDCGSNGNGVILDFNAKNGDTKAPNCKFSITVNTGVPALP